jgi:hypothetical protein
MPYPVGIKVIIQVIKNSTQVSENGIPSYYLPIQKFMPHDASEIQRNPTFDLTQVYSSENSSQ